MQKDTPSQSFQLETVLQVRRVLDIRQGALVEGDKSFEGNLLLDALGDGNFCLSISNQAAVRQDPNLSRFPLFVNVDGDFTAFQQNVRGTGKMLAGIRK